MSAAPAPASARAPAPPLALRPLLGPLLLELGLGLGIGLLGTLLAARAGDASAAAFALGQQVAALLFILLRILGAGVSVVVAQHLGAGNGQAADTTAQASLWGASGLGLALAVAAALGAPAWMALLQAPPEVAPEAARFLQALAPALVLDAVVATQCGVLRAHLRARTTLALNAGMQGVHAVGALVLMPVWGLEGWAVAMAASRVAGVALGSRWGQALRWRAAPPWTAQWAALRAVLDVGLPAAAENILYRVCATVSVAVAGMLGSGALAAQAYALQLSMITLLPGLALGLAMEVLVGQTIGQRDLRGAHQRVLAALLAGVAASIALAIGVALCGPWLLPWFTQDPQMLALVQVLLWWTVLLEPGRTFNIVLINGLRAAGDTRFPVMAGAVSMVVVLAGGSWVLGRWADWGLVGVWVAYIADEWVRGLLMAWRWQSLRWTPHARAVLRTRGSDSIRAA